MHELPDLAPIGLRLLGPGDAPELQALVEANREHLARWVPWAADQTLRDCEAFIESTRQQLAADNGFQAAVVREGAIRGVVGFHAVNWGNRATSLGYWLAEAEQGRGTMTAAVRALVDHAFGPWGLHRVEIQAAPANRRSRAIPERLGFRREALLRENERVGGRYLDSVVYGMLAEEWGRRGAGGPPEKDDPVAIVKGGRERIADLQPLWESLRRHHAAVAPHLRQLGPERSAADSWAVRRALYEELLAEPDAFVLLAEDGSRPVGYALVHIRGPEETWATGRIAEISTLAVLPELRGRGTGGRLIEALAAELRGLGIGHLEVASIATNTEAHRFYERLGLLDFTVSYIGPVPESGS